MPGTCGVGGWGGPVAGDPGNNSVLSATPAFGGIKVSWILPSTNPYAVAYVKLYRGASLTFGSATWLADVGDTLYYDYQASATEYWYWIEIVSINGTVGAPIGPVSATASPMLAGLLTLLTGEVDNDLLSIGIRNELDQIGVLNTALSTEVANRIAGDAVLAAAMALMQIDVNAANAYILGEIGTRGDETSALALLVDDVVASLADYVQKAGSTMTGVLTASAGVVGNLTGNASTATALQTARTIGGTSFDGTSNIAIALAAAATALATARTINGVSFDGTGNITVAADASTLTGTSLPVTVLSSSLTSVGTLGSLGVTGTATAGAFTGAGTGLTGTAAALSIGGAAATAALAAAATALATARTINGVSFDGTANITIFDSTKQDTLINSGVGQNIRTINGSDILGTGNLVITGGSGSGLGDVSGPGAAVVGNHVVFWDGTTGTLIKDSGLTLSGTNTGDQTNIAGYASLNVLKTGDTMTGALSIIPAALGAKLILAADGGTPGTDDFEIEQGHTSKTAYLWNYANTPMVFGTNNAERMRIAAAGELVISKTGEALKLESATVGTLLYQYIHNTSATAGSGAGLIIGTTPGSAGDQYVRFDDGDSGAFWALGVDGSDNGDFKLSRSTTLGTNDALHVTGAGLVGIGGTAAAHALEIRSAAANILLAPATATNNALLRFTNTGGNAYIGLDNSGGGLGGAYSLNLWHGGAYPIVFATTNVERMRIDSAGNVGIGTTPTVYSGYTVVEAKGKTTTIGGIFKTTSFDGVTSAEYSVAGGAGYFGTVTAHPQAFMTNGTERMRIDASGNVLIGSSTLVSAERFSVHKNANSAAYALIRNSDVGAAATAGLVVNASGNSWFIGMGSGANNSNALVFNIDALGAPVERMRIDASGNVGIGVSPSYKLHVNGKISYNGSIGEGADDTLSSASTQVRLAPSATWQSVAIYTNGSEKLSVNSAGYFGFNTPPLSGSNPTVVIKSQSAYPTLGLVSNTTSLQSHLALSKDGTTWETNLISNGSAAGSPYAACGAGDSVLNALNNHLWLGTYSAKSIKFATTSLQRMEIAADGKVGINTTPAYPVHILAINQAPGLAVLSGGATNYTAIGVGRTVPEAYFGVAGAAGNFFTGSGQGDTTLMSTSNLLTGTSAATFYSFITSNAERMRIDAAGNVGIGRTPSYRLDVTQGVTGSKLFRFSAAGGADLFGYSDSGGSGITNTDPYTSGALVYLHATSIAYYAHGASGVHEFIANAGTRLTINAAGTIRFNSYGAGTLVTDSSGNITASSDARLKTNVMDWGRGLDAIMALRPVSFNWNEDSKLNQDDLNVGLIAQEVLEVIPEAVNANAEGMYSMSDRPIIMALVNAVKELTARVRQLETQQA